MGCETKIVCLSLVLAQFSCRSEIRLGSFILTTTTNNKFEVELIKLLRSYSLFSVPKIILVRLLGFQ